MSPRDTGRARYYDAEHLVHRLFDTASSSSRTVQIAGTELTLPAEARFASVDAVRDYVRRVLALPSVRERFPRASEPVSVRERRGQTSAHYARATTASGDEFVRAEIAIPSSESRWALRELVVLHELAHHLDDSEGPGHGRGFVLTLIELVGLVLGPEAAFVFRVVLADSGIG